MSEKKSHGCLLGGLGCLAAIGLLAVLIVVVGVCVSDAPEPKVPSVQEATVDDLKAEVKRGQELLAWLRIRNDQTELQRKEAFAQFKGKYVIFNGKVREIGKTMFSEEVFVSLTVGRKSLLEDINIQFNIPDQRVESVKSWTKDEVHILRGRVKSTGDLVDDIVCAQGECVPNDKYRELVQTTGGGQAASRTNAVGELIDGVVDGLVGKAVDGLVGDDNKMLNKAAKAAAAAALDALRSDNQNNKSQNNQ